MNSMLMMFLMMTICLNSEDDTVAKIYCIVTYYDAYAADDIFA